MVLYDGICGMCDGFVSFCINRDQRELLQFASLESVAGKRLRAKFNLPTPAKSFVLIEDGVAYQQSDAALREWLSVCTALRVSCSPLALHTHVLRIFVYNLSSF